MTIAFLIATDAGGSGLYVNSASHRDHINELRSMLAEYRQLGVVHRLAAGRLAGSPSAAFLDQEAVRLDQEVALLEARLREELLAWFVISALGPAEQAAEYTRRQVAYLEAAQRRRRWLRDDAASVPTTDEVGAACRIAAAYDAAGALAAGEIDDLVLDVQKVAASTAGLDVLCDHAGVGIKHKIDWMLRFLSGDGAAAEMLHEWRSEQEDVLAAHAEDGLARAERERLEEFRDADLSSAAEVLVEPRRPAPSREHPHVGTKQFQQARGAEARVARDIRAREDLPAVIAEIYGLDEVATLSRPLSEVDSSGAAKAKHDRASRTLRREAEEWVRANDDRSTVIGVVDAIAVAGAGGGLTLDEMRVAFPAKAGKPSHELRQLRSQVREALKPLYDAGHKPELMCAELGCSSDALWRLLK